MKAFLLLLLVAFGGWQYYQHNLNSPAPVETHADVQPYTDLSNEPLPVEPPIFSQPTQNFRCDGRQHCSQMNSREEAEFFVQNCPDVKMDGDDDGIPCEDYTRLRH